MNELKVVAQATPAEVSWNFESIKLVLAAEMKHYQSLVYTDDAIKMAKADIAELRKIRKEVEDRRKWIKEKCLEPYHLIEEQAKELTALIDAPIALIDGQVKEYEARRLEERREEIRAYKESVYSVLPEKVAEALMKQPNSPAWEKLSASRKFWRNEIGGRCVEVQNDLDAIKSLDADFQDEAMEKYLETFSIPVVLRQVEDLRRQRDKVLAREREKQEAAARAAEKPVSVAPAPAPVAAPVEAAPVKREAQPSEQKSAAPVQDGGRTIRFYGTTAQYSKLLGYIKFMGANYKEVQG